ncbi:MAG: acyl-CoA dehydrogenase family protein [Actinomycetota bacterium]
MAIDFALQTEQQAIQKLAHDFAASEMRPRAADADEQEQLPWEVVERAAEAGLTGFGVPAEYGGRGLDPVSMALVSEELFWGDAGMATSIEASQLAIEPLLIAGTEPQKKEFLPRLCDPKRPALAAFALTEQQTGSDVAALRTTARPEGDSFVINGDKMFISNGGIADFYTVWATVDPSAGYQGVVGFVADAKTPGISQGQKLKKHGIRSSHTAEVIFEDVAVPAENRIGEEGKGFHVIMETLNQSRAGVAAGAVGVARAAFEDALRYAKSRKAFGKPLIAQEAISFMLADMATKIQAGRNLYLRAAWLAARGEPNSLESSIAKVFCGDMAMEVASDAVQIHGGYGYLREYPVERYLRDAKIMQIYEGTQQIQRIVIAGNLMNLTTV